MIRIQPKNRGIRNLKEGIENRAERLIDLASDRNGIKNRCIVEEIAWINRTKNRNVRDLTPPKG
jgi:hypothetical protein